MRFLSILTLAGILLGSTPSLAQMPGWQVMKTKHDFKTLVSRLDKAVANNKMGLVTRASASAGAEGRGLKIAGNMIVGVYRNDYAVRMLEASIPAGIEAPIRFYITENNDKTATLSYQKPSVVFAPYEDGGDKLVELAKELDGVFSKIAEEAVQP